MMWYDNGKGVIGMVGWDYFYAGLFLICFGMLVWGAVRKIQGKPLVGSDLKDLSAAAVEAAREAARKAKAEKDKLLKK